MNKRIVKIMAWGTGAVLTLALFTVIAFTLTLLWLGSNSGREWIAGQIEERIASDTMSVDIGNIQTLNNRHVIIDTISLYDQNGLLSEFKDIQLDYMLEPLLTGAIRIDDLDLKEINIHRLPANNNKESASTTLPKIPDLQIGRLNVETITLAKPITGRPEKLSLNGAIALSPSSITDSTLKLTLLDKISQRKLVDIGYSLKDKAAPSLYADVSDKGQGIVAKLTGLDSLNIRLDGNKGKAGWEGNLTANIQYDSYALHLEKPAHIVLTEDKSIKISNFVASFNSGHVHLDGTFGVKKFEAHIRTQNLSTNLQVYPFLYDGQLDGEIQLSGPYRNPKGSADLKLKHLTVPGLKNTEDRYVSGTITATYKNTLLKAKADLSGPAGLQFQAEGGIPLTLFPLNIPFDKPVRASLNSSVNLRAITILLGLDQHRITGKSSLDMTLDGTLGTPIVKGTGTLENGTYENILTGTEFQNISAKIFADNDRLNIIDLKGSDRNGGQFTGSGEIAFKDINNPAYNLTLETDRLQITNLDRMGIMASGKLTSEGDKEKAHVKGNITINQAEYYIGELIGGSSLSDFEIIEINGDKIVENPSSPKSNGGPDITLDIDIDANNNVFVRGHDLETEWSGDLAVSGTLAAPIIKGAMNLIRGSFQLLDTPVDLPKGQIRFINPDPANPALDVRGTIKGKEMDATLKIDGEAQKPEITLTSDPALPEDEILAKTLFGESLSQLSPVQALRIAQLMAYLSGRKEAGFDPLGQIRRTIGIDTLGVGLDEEKGATLSVGKYINDRVYIGLDQGATPESSAVRAEIEVTDEIDVETVTGSAGESSLGINWKHDY